MRGLKAEAKDYLRSQGIKTIAPDAGVRKLALARTIDVVKAAVKVGW